MSNTRVRVIDLVYEALRKANLPLTLGELADRTGVPKNQISAAIAKAIPEGGPIHREAHGVYAYGVEDYPHPDDVPLTDAQISADAAVQEDRRVAAVEGGTRGYTPPGEGAKQIAHVRKVRQRIKDLDDALTDLHHYLMKVEAKARAYDKVQLTINGRVEDPL
jgi:hypothetical protein